VSMIVPRYWAEGRAQHRAKGKQVTIRRFGWSQTSEAEAQANADARANEGLQRVLSGEKLIRREPKVPYNGAEGVPIREEIVAEHGETVITRNSYGALCLNTPDVLFADVDFAPRSTAQAGCLIMLLLLVPSAWKAWDSGSFKLFIGLAISSLVVGQLLGWSGRRIFTLLSGGSKNIAFRRLRRFVNSHRDWRLRVYRTPAGLRVLAMHRFFKPDEPAVKKFFQALGGDPVYVRMCQLQHCFRARVSPKPWRIGMETHMKPRPGVWPVSPEKLPARRAWVDAYHEKAATYSSCQFDSEMGDGPVHPGVQVVQKLHDQLSRAESGLPAA
jgi:hypothetical protein